MIGAVLARVLLTLAGCLAKMPTNPLMMDMP
jgi:hypothetical protein